MSGNGYKFLLAVTLSSSSLCISAQVPELPNALSRFAAGVDISEVKTLQEHGAIYRVHGISQDPLRILHHAGISWARIRLFVHPDGRGPLTNDLSYALAEVKDAKRNHLRVLLDMHFSDSWADPGQQNKPAAWANLVYAQLVQQVKSYATDTLRTFADANVTPDMVEVGNEITNGMLWPEGQLTWKGQDDMEWQQLSDLLKAGEDGILEGAGPKNKPLIMIHLDRGGDIAKSSSFFDHILARGVHLDVIGLSDYPWWQGTLEQLSGNLAALARTYHKPIIVVETGFPWSPQSFAVGGHTYTGAAAEENVLHFPPTPKGQAEYLRKLIGIVRATPEGLGVGVFYWAGMWLQNKSWGAPEWSGDWEHRALFGENGEALPALFALGSAGKLKICQ
jgi:arabinogalactan endo-1,4-beta-galactosidase